jgi:fluoroacetyl-CoA thioesterase
MRQIPLGAKGSFSLLAQPEHLADRFKDATLAPVLATPVIITVMENAALNAIRAYLDPGRAQSARPLTYGGILQQRRLGAWLLGG